MIESTDGGVVIAVRVVPRAARSELAGRRAGALLVRLQAPPVEGAANAALVEFLAGVFDVPRRSVSILGGERSRHKRVRIAGISLEMAAARLGQANG